MGLDIYLEHVDNVQDKVRIEGIYHREYEKIWKLNGRKYEDLSESEKDECRKKEKELAERVGCDDWGGYKGAKKIELNSQKYPGHMFKIGYFRSSYNDSGINSLFKRLGLPDLYDLFPHVGEDDFVPDWKESRMLVIKALEELAKFMKKSIAKYDCFEVDLRNVVAKSKTEALAKFEERLTRYLNQEGGFDNYQCSDGHFQFTPLKVAGFIPGKTEHRFFGADNVMYVIYETERMDWYQLSYEIVLETIDWVLSQEDPQKYYLVWSG